MRRIPLITLLMLCLSITTVVAQVSVCSPIIDNALTQLDQSCGNLSRNTACYGSTLVQATFAEITEEDPVFTTPSDVVALNILASIRASALDEEEETWGIAVMSALANLPGTLPGQGVVMLVMGDTEVTNQVPADEAFVAVQPLNVVVNSDGSRIRSGAGLSFNIVSAVARGEILLVDARNTAGDWLRVSDGDEIGGWMYKDLMNITTAQIESLPIVNDTIQSPMQSFYFTTGIGNANCQQAPDAVLVQSPRGTQVSLTINEAEITLGSTVLFETEPNQMILYVLDGEAQVNNLIIPEGYKAFVPLNNNGQIVQDLAAQGITTVQAQQLPAISGQWEGCSRITDEDRTRLATLPNISASFLNYPIQLPTVPNRICASPEEIFAIAATRNAPDPTSPPAPGVTPDTPAQPEQTQEVIVDGYDCSPFRLASPREGMAFGVQPFYWDPPNPGAASYDVFVYDDQGGLVAQSTTSATTVTLDTGDRNPSGGVYYSWTVQAKDANGNVVCGPLEPAVQLREAAPIATPEPPERTEEPEPPACDVDGLYAKAKETCEYGYEVYEDECSYICFEG